MHPKTALNALLDIEHPIVLAPMAGISGGALAAAVSGAGGLGLIGGGYGDRAWLEAQLPLCAGRAFGIGFITWALRGQPDLLRLALAHRPRAVMLSFGDLGEFARPVRDAGAVLLAQVQTLRQARQAAQEGAQVIVAQGAEAGGHGGVRGSLALVPAVVDAVGPLPVLAAGGVADGRGLAAALMLGAAGVLCGTVFYAAEESLAHPQAKQRLVAASGDETTQSDVYDRVRGLEWPSGPWSLRTLRNRFTERWAGRSSELAESMGEERARFTQAREQGDFDTAAVIAGEAADLVKAVAPAGEIVRSMVAQAEALLSGGGRPR